MALPLNNLLLVALALCTVALGSQDLSLPMIVHRHHRLTGGRCWTVIPLILRGGAPGHSSRPPLAFLDRLFRRQRRESTPRPHRGFIRAEDNGMRATALQASREVQTLDDEECLRHIERWKRSGQPGATLLKSIVTLGGSCFVPEDSEEDDGDDASGWFSVLQIAVERGHLQTLRGLVSHGVGGIVVDARGRHGQTALHIAAARGRQDVMHVLFDLGANAEATDLLGWTALHQAAYYAQTAAARLLVETYKASTNVLTSAGLSPLGLAEEQLKRDSPSISWGKNVDPELRRSHLEEICTYLRGLQSPPRSAGSAGGRAQNGGGNVVQQRLSGLIARFAALPRDLGKSKSSSLSLSAPHATNPPQPPSKTQGSGSSKSISQEIDGAVLQAYGAAGGADELLTEPTLVDMSRGDGLPFRAASPRPEFSPARCAAAATAAAAAPLAPQVAPAGATIGAATSTTPLPAKQQQQQQQQPGATPAAEAGEEEEPVICGVGVTLHLNANGDYVIKAVAPKGPADLASESGAAPVQPGDVLNAVDGQPVRDVTYGELASWILGNAGTKVQISLCRGGEGEVVNVTLTRAALGISARQAVKDGMAREKVCLQQMLLVQRDLQQERAAMAAEIVELRRRAQTAENEARVWKAISQQNSAANSKAASPYVSQDDSSEDR